MHQPRRSPQCIRAHQAPHGSRSSAFHNGSGRIRLSPTMRRTSDSATERIPAWRSSSARPTCARPRRGPSNSATERSATSTCRRCTASASNPADTRSGNCCAVTTSAVARSTYRTRSPPVPLGILTVRRTLTNPWLRTGESPPTTMLTIAGSLPRNSGSVPEAGARPVDQHSVPGPADGSDEELSTTRFAGLKQQYTREQPLPESGRDTVRDRASGQAQVQSLLAGENAVLVSQYGRQPRVGVKAARHPPTVGAERRTQQKVAETVDTRALVGRLGFNADLAG
jgi:hypothetical protein